MRWIVACERHIALACHDMPGGGIGIWRQGGHRISHRMREAQVSFDSEACHWAAQIAEMRREGAMDHHRAIAFIIGDGLGIADL